MSTTAKIISVIGIIIVAGGLYYWYTQSQNVTPAQGAPAAMENPSDETATATNAAPADTDTSDSSIAQDSAAIDAQMSGLASDNASMNSSDQPVAQSY